MPAPTAPGADWKKAREDFEAGAKSRREIAAEQGVTPQAVDKRAQREGWVKPAHSTLKEVSRVWLARAEELEIGDETARKRTRHAAAALADAISRGLPQALAAPLAGITRETFITWRDEDPKLKQLVDEAEARWAADRVRNLTEASERGDAQTTRWALERHAATREHFRSAESAGGGIVINVVLQGLAPSTSPDAGPVIDAAAEPGAPLMLPSDPPQNTQE